jgi:NAD(P) transhydrogenase subunit alpha
MIVGVPRESFPGERRVALVPAVVPNLTKAGLEVLVESDAGLEAGYTNAEYEGKGAKIASSREDVFARADIIVQVLCYGSNDRTGAADLPLMRKGQFLIGFLRPLGTVDTVEAIARTGVTSFSVELMPRTTRAQSMDALSSMATACGYKAVLIAADTLPRIFPMLTTAAGTITPARVLVIGAGVAGLQAIATARRLGAVVSAYDVRPVAKEQVQSLGGRFVELPLEVKDAQDAGGYAKAQDESFYQRQRELLGKVIAESDVVITTAVVPGKKAPVLVTKEMVAGMAPGSVILDLAAERGGNCELTKSGEKIAVNGVSIIGSINLASSVPYHASQMYSRNITNFLLNMVKDGKVNVNMQDDIISSTLVTEGGEIANPRIREFFALPTLVAQA